MKRIGIFGRESDSLVRHMAARVADAGATPIHIDLAQVVLGAPLAFDGEAWLLRGEEVSACDAFFLRNVPAETVMLDSPEATGTAEEWFQGSMQAKARAQVARSFVGQMEREGKTVVNPLLTIDAFDYKPLQLRELHHLGLATPRTLVTNFPEGVLAFRDEVGEVVYKPAAGGWEAQLLDEGAIERLDRLAPLPVIFQERVRGPDVRVTVVGGRIVSSVELPTDAVIDYRSAEGYEQGGQRYVAHELPPEVAADCLRVAERFGHRLSGIDLKHTPEGRYVFIEANSSPVYLDIELKTKTPITDAIVELLIGR